MPQLAKHLRALPSPGSATADAIQWSRFCGLLDNDTDLESALQQVDFGPEQLDVVVSSTWHYINRHCLALADQLHTQGYSLPLSRLLSHFARVANPRIQVVTTNYDRVVEYAADLAGLDHYTGFRSGYYRTFRTTREHREANRPVQIWKVHGSLDWFRTLDGRTFSRPLARDIPADTVPLVVTPGTSKYRTTHEDPYRAIIAAADDALASADSLLCIGFGFNDEHIQPRLVGRAATDGRPIVVVTRDLSDAAMSTVIHGAIGNFVAIEKHEDGSRVFTDEARAPLFFPGLDLWSLNGFQSTLLGVRI